MKKLPSLSLFFPAYNEEANITDAITNALEVGQKVSDVLEVVVVNDGSRDKTRELAEKFVEKDSRVRVVNHAVNQGYGAAVLSGLKASKYDYVFFSDSDLQFDFREITKLLEFVPDYDAVIGYRTKRADSLSFMRLMNAKGWNMLNRLLFGLKVKDIDCAFKLFKRDILRGIKLQSRGAMLSAELLIRLMRRGVRFKEVPVAHLPNKTGQTTGAKPRVILRAFKELIFVYLELRKDQAD